MPQPFAWLEPLPGSGVNSNATSWERFFPDHLHLKSPHRSLSHCHFILFTAHCVQLPRVLVHVSTRCPFPAECGLCGQGPSVSFTMYLPRTVIAQSSCSVSHCRRVRRMNGHSGAKLGWACRFQSHGIEMAISAPGYGGAPRARGHGKRKA